MNPTIDSEPQPIVEGGRRNYSGWVIFGMLFLFAMVANTASTSKQKPARLQGHELEQANMKQVLSADSLTMAMSAALGKPQPSSHESLSKSLDDPISSLVLEADKDLFASMLYAEMRTYQNRAVPEGHLQLLANSKLPEDQAFFKIYTSKTLTRKEADDLISKLPAQPFVYQAARVQALEKAGDKDAVRRIVSPVSSIGIALMGLAALPFMGASFAIWAIFWRRSREGAMKPKGIPLDSITNLDADRLAIRAAQIFTLYMVMGIVVMFLVSQLNLALNESEIGMLGGILTIGAILGLQNIPIDGKKIQLALMGFNARNLFRDVVLGVVGFIAELPVAVMLAELSITILKFLPKATHPASEALEHTHDLRTVIPILIGGCIIAPIWEELVFRGLLFPALKRLLGGLVPGILVSSFLFAAVHPQGITMWLPLAFVGASSCYLSYQSRSLVPGMVMHCLHNAAFFAITLLR